MADYDPTNDIANPTRKNPLLALVAGIVFLVITHLFIDRIPGAFKLFTSVANLLVTLGIAGIVDPWLFYGVMDQAKGAYPGWVRPTSIALAIIGMLFGVVLLVAVYKAFP